MKVLIVGPKSIHVSLFVQALNRLEITPSLLTEADCDIHNVDEKEIISFRSFNPLNIVSSFFELKKFLKRLQPDIVHVHQINRLAFFVTHICNRLNIPVVSTAWGSDVLLIPNKNTLFKYLVRKSLSRSYVVTGDSQNIIDEMNKLVPDNSKYQLLQYGIDFIKPVEKEEIIYSNRLHEELYRIDEIITYFHEFHIDYPNWKLVIAGSGSQTSSLKNQVERLNLNSYVEFVGWLSKKENNSWYAKSQIYISIPKSDGTSVSLLEAISAGCLPIVSDIPVSREWIEDGKNGVIDSREENPMSKALTLEVAQCKVHNLKLITNLAERGECTLKFVQIYKQCIEDSSY